MNGTTAYALSKKYVEDTSISLGAVKGAPCTIKSITEVDGGQKVTFEWTGTSGTKQTSEMTVKNGVSITSIDIDSDNNLVCTMSDGTEQKAKINILDNVYTKSETNTLLLDKAEKNHNHDSAYASKDTEHEHTNKETLDKFGVNDGGKLTFNGDVVTPEASDLSDYLKKTDAQDTYVAKETGKGLSENDFTTDLKDVYDKAVEDSHTHTNKSIIDKFSESADGALLYDGQSIEADLSTVYKKTETYSQTEADNKFVAKETGKGLSTNDYTTEEKDKLAGLDNYDDTQVKTAIQTVANGLMDSVGYSADYKSIDIIAKNGVKKSVNVAPIISHASITELSDVDTTNKATGKALVYNATTSKHEYADVSGTDEKVKMDASTDAKYLGELLDNITIANENGELKVKKLDGQEVTITEINYLKGLTMNVMDLVNMFSNGGVKIINTPVATYAELLTLDKSSFIEGISYLVYVLADENHDNAKTTYLVDKDSETPTYFGFADSQRDFTTNPIDLATEITGKLGIANMDSDAIKALFTVDDTYKTETATNNAFSTHGAKALYDELLLAIGNKANSSDLTAHKDDTDIHVSTEDRTNWDSAKTHADSAHAPSNAQENVLETVKVNGTALTPSSKAVNIDLSDYAKTTDIPTTLPADGGNSATVNGHTIKSDVPENAVFTDTTYSDATQIEHGLMSVDDKKKLDGLKKYTPDGSTITADEDGTLHGVKVTVDDAISSESINPVQNKVVKAYVDKKASENVDFSTSTSKLLNGTVEAPLVMSKATRNLLNPSLLTIKENDLKDSGITGTINSDGSITLNGTATRSIWSVLYTTHGSGKNNMFEGLRVFSNLNYNESGVYGELYIAYCKDNDGKKEIWRSGHDGDLIPDGNGEPCWVRLHITSGATFNNETFFIMFTDDEEGAVNDKLIPYSGYDIKTCGKNLANVDMPTKTNNGVVCTDNGDGTYTLNGTATAEASFALVNNRSELYKRIVGKNILFLNGGHKWSRDYRILFNVSNSDFTKWGTEKYDGDSFVVPSGYEKAVVDIHVKTGVTVNNLVVKPMITFDLDATNDDFEPYQDGGSVHIDSSTEFPLLGLKSFDGEINIISPGNVEVTYAKSDSGAAILDMSEKSVKDARKETTVNLLKPTLQTSTSNGVTCTNNGDGTYTLNGTTTSSGAGFNLIGNEGGNSVWLTMPADGKIIFAKGDATSKIGCAAFKSEDGAAMWAGRIIPKGTNIRNIYFSVWENQTLDNVVIKPMLTTNLNATYDDFVSYTGDGETLTHDVAEIKKDLGDLTFSASGTTLTITDGTNTWTLEANS